LEVGCSVDLKLLADVMPTILIDNNDSFTYNLVELIRSIEGIRPDVVRTSEVEIDGLARFDRIILSPGPGVPDVFPNLKKVLAEYAGMKPILGVCLGHQTICEYFGGRLFYLPNVVHGYPAEIHLSSEPGKLYKGVEQEFRVGLYHSLAVSRDYLPTVLRITGVSEEGIVMSFEHRDFPIYGIQYHPESFITEYGRTIMKNFLEMK
jgi:para-aminobenzoate synthetase component II